MSGENILVVEDEWSVGEHICSNLQSFGYNASSVACSGEEAIMMIEKERPDLVLMDIVLYGEMDGIEAADRIASQFDIPVIYLTAYVNDNNISRAKLTKPFGYIVKPFNNRELYSNIEMALHKHKLEKELKECKARLDKTLKGAIEALTETIEMRGSYTPGHHQRVKKLAAAIAGEMGLPDFQVQGIELAAAVYDIGLINVPIEISQDVSRQEGVRLALYRTYPTVGYDILKKIDFSWSIAEIILQHRECYDGAGFPRGMKGDDILIEARIIAVADVIEDLTTHRIHRNELPIDKALAVIRNNRGALYDPEVVDACLRLFNEKGYKITD
jgi:putative two-component system response regulator